MSWLYSQALVEEYSEDISLDGARCALWNGKHTPQASWLPAKTTKHCQLSQSGMTFKPLTEDHGEAVLMSFLGDFPAKTSVAPGRAKESKVSGHPCGNTWRESLEKFDLETSSWKTHQCLWDEDLQPSSVILPKWGMMLNGVLWERITAPLPIKGTGSGSWPTPRSCSAMAATITPESANDPSRFPNLETVVGKVTWPTPKSRDYKDTTGCSLDATNPDGSDRDRRDRLVGAVVDRYGQPAKTMQLNPEWTEWLMGWPVGWTSMEAITELDWRDWSVDPADELPPKDIGTPRATQAIRSDEFRKGRTPSPEEYIIEAGAGNGSIPRVATGIKHRVGRLKAIGNGQVPAVAALAWDILSKGNHAS